MSSVNDDGRSHVLQANDELDKRHWLQCIDEARSREVLPDTTAKLRSHSGDMSSTDTLCADFQSPSNSTDEHSAAAESDEEADRCTSGASKQLPPLTPLTSSSRQVSKHMFEEL